MKSMLILAVGLLQFSAGLAIPPNQPRTNPVFDSLMDEIASDSLVEPDTIKIATSSSEIHSSTHVHSGSEETAPITTGSPEPFDLPNNYTIPANSPLDSPQNQSKKTKEPKEKHTKPPSAPGSVPLDLVRWQSKISDSVPISSLSLPGTHNTMAYRATYPIPTQIFGWQCQHNSLRQQLEKGVRYLDLRLEHRHNKFRLHHGLAQLDFSFTRVIRTLERFYEVSPDETLIIRMACNNCHEKSSRKGHNGNTREFWDTMRWYMEENPDTKNFFSKRLYMGDGIPTLGEARGKIIPLQANAGGDVPGFIRWTDTSKLIVQDDWEPQGGKFWRKKVQTIKDFFKLVLGIQHPHLNPDAAIPPITLNHFTMAHWFWWGPKNITKYVWKKLYNEVKFLWDNGGGHPMGVAILDFATEAVTRSIVEKNWLERGAMEGHWDEIDWEWEKWTGGWRQDYAGMGKRDLDGEVPAGLEEVWPEEPEEEELENMWPLESEPEGFDDIEELWPSE
ncbi:PLC-like phosphodiesterase [Pyronema omphalodes]|nr:PLC-like phosphodiesterase [Pyronema omphalodes]